MTLVVASISILAMANLTSTSVSNNQKSNENKKTSSSFVLCSTELIG